MAEESRDRVADREFQEHLEACSYEVSGWPDWKQNALGPIRIIPNRVERSAFYLVHRQHYTTPKVRCPLCENKRIFALDWKNATSVQKVFMVQKHLPYSRQIRLLIAAMHLRYPAGQRDFLEELADRDTNKWTFQPNFHVPWEPIKEGTGFESVDRYYWGAILHGFLENERSIVPEERTDFAKIIIQMAGIGKIWDDAWKSSTVIDLAENIYQSRAWANTPILADALEDTGCTDEILTELRTRTDFMRGDWIIDQCRNFFFSGWKIDRSRSPIIIKGNNAKS